MEKIDRMHAERDVADSLAAANRLWQKTFDAINEAITIQDKEFRILQCNAAMSRLIGRPASEMIGRHCWEVLHGSDGPVADCPCPRVMRSRRRESAILTIDNRTIKVDVDPQFDDHGDLVRFVHILSDITRQQKADDTIRETHQTLLTVLDSIEATIFAADIESHEILFMNNSMKETFQGDFTGQKCWQAFYRLTEGPCAHCNCSRLLDKTGNPAGSCVWESQNPLNQRWYVNYDRAIKWVDGRYVHLQVATDITELKHMEQQRQRTDEYLRQAQKMEAIGTLAGGIAHDFNNILSAILGYSELALDDALRNVAAAGHIRQILKAGYRARDLVQQILTFSRHKESEFKPLQIRPIIKEALKLLRASLPTTIAIEQQLNSEAMVEADATQIHQIIMNLCTNAGHAMRTNGGTMRVSLAEAVLAPEFFHNHPGLLPGRYLCLEVSDTGCGIDPGIIDGIFDPYFTTKQKGEGIGMGLAMVHSIVQNCHGTVTVESLIDQGACFKVYLPVISPENLHPSKLETPVPGGHERILFVDDEPPLAHLGKQLLERLGYQVTICTSSTDALAIFEKDPADFDIVVTDMTMPHMTGDAMALRMLAARPGIPIVLCTGYSEKITSNMITQLGIRALIMKPLARAEMARAIRQALDASSPEG